MESMSLLGFLDTKSELSVTDHTVCEGASFSFFDGTTFNNLQGDTAHISTIPSSQLNWDSLIVENVIVNPIMKSPILIQLVIHLHGLMELLINQVRICLR